MSVVEIERAEPEPLMVSKPKPLTNEDKERALLELAADILIESGWCRGNYTVFGRHCALGALGAAVRRTPGVGRVRRDEASKRLALRIGRAAWADRAGVAQWNDHVARSGAEVIRTLKEAAAG